MYAVLTFLLSFLFSCRHRHYSFPISVPKQRVPLIRPGADMYVVCLDCARQFPYDWEQMKVVWSPPKQKVASEPQKAAGERQQAVSF
jgi:hypothetical protein